MFDAQGQPLGDAEPFDLGGDIWPQHRDERVAVDSFILSWIEYHEVPSPNFNIYSQVFDINGIPVSAPFIVH